LRAFDMAAETKKTPGPVRFDGSSDFRRKIVESVGDEILACYQCLKCSAGCPASFAMDMLPHQVIRAVIFGRPERVLASRTIWVCASCETCTTRCPNRIDIAGVMDRLRQMSIESGKAAAVPRIPVLHEVFLEGVRKRGRLHELSMMRIYSMKSGELRKKLRSGAWRSDVRLGTKLLWRGKLRILASRCRDMDSVREIFDRAREMKKK
jgi:heterodisulfide reductase subunit C